jgi:hypothetical protein
MIKLLILFFVVSIVSCGTNTPVASEVFRDSIPIVSFCDLPGYKGQKVYLKCYYSGIDEYWSLSNIKKKKCKPDLTVDLQFSGYSPFMTPEKFQDVFSEVHDNYNNSYLKIEAIGLFENDSKHGYGHLGHNNARFTVSELIKAELVKK